MTIFKLKEVEFLRGLAALSVVAYHFSYLDISSHFFTNGYLGVDVFFVISGFVIYLHIYNRKLRDQFSLREFYNRRLLRLAPNILFWGLITVAFAFHFEGSDRFREIMETTVSSVFFLSNYYFYLNSLEYWAMSPDNNPLFHTWSLSVEFQFYLLFPLIFLFSFRNLKSILLLLFFTSFASYLYFSHENSMFGFFSSSSRAWEFVVGALAANRYVCSSNKEHPKSGVVSVFAIVLLLSIMTFDFKNTNYSLLQLIVVFCTYQICSELKSFPETLSGYLGNPIFAYLGKISYSIYITHIPITYFLKFYTYNNLLIFIAILAVSAANFHLIEEPFRQSEGPARRRSLTICILTTILIVGLYIGRISPTSDFKLFSEPLKPWELSYSSGKEAELCYASNPGTCVFGTGQVNIYAVGDSNLDAIMRPYRDIFDTSRYTLHLLTNSGCYFAPGLQSWNYRLDEPVQIPGVDCNEEYQEKRLQYISKSDGYKVVILGGFLDEYIREDLISFKGANTRWLYSIVDEIEKLSQIVDRVIIVYPTPSVNYNVYEKAASIYKDSCKTLQELCLGSLIELRRKLVLDVLDFHKRTSEAFNVLDKIEARNISRVYPHEDICDSTYCYFVKGDSLTLIDTNHPSYYFSSLVAQKLIRTISEFDLVR